MCTEVVQELGNYRIKQLATFILSSQKEESHPLIKVRRIMLVYILKSFTVFLLWLQSLLSVFTTITR